MDDEMRFSIGDDGKLTEYEEPYSTIECKTEEDYDKLLVLINKSKRMKVVKTETSSQACPVCGINVNSLYCPHCGQRLTY